ncbi:hypothetical protein CEN44_16625 [Fischerella muscicola CCMEE 5323]|uniref:Uncharacterized protein n=1 Tax=Fischerella muscicola CCMEE 5323 TaxID=2019572 RepID=A0A2N6K0S3_FISMU|nr:hypothetical protein CEN44_16625 [Fischerella muscicola CCMEE 5323]
MLNEYKHKTADLYSLRSHHYDEAQAKTEYDAQLEALVTGKGIWNDITIFFTLGRKPMDDFS